MSSLPLLPLAHPLILLPAARVTIPVSKDLGEAILTLIDQSESLPIVAAIPVTSPTPDPNATPVLAKWGVAARVLRLVKPPARNPRQPYLVSLHGLNRIRLDTTATLHVPTTHLTPHPVEYPPPDSDSIPPRALVDKFKDSALRLLDRLARDSVHQSRKEGYLKIANMMEDITDQRAVWMADVLVGSINGDYNDKLEILCTADPSTRLVLSTQFFLKQAAVSEVSKKISSAVDESLSKQQKEFFLRQQLAAIQRELHSLSSSSSSSSSQSSSSPPSDKDKENNGPPSELDDDEQHETDDLLDLKRRIEAMELGSEERKMGVREWRRLKRIPTGSVENGVIRTYLEWLTSIPWPNSSLDTTTTTAITTTDVIPSPPPTSISNRSFLAAARAQLDNDHFGLEKIKKRLIEYLAVVRLKERREKEREKEVLEQEETGRTNAGAKDGDGKALQVASNPNNPNNNINPNPNPNPNPNTNPTPGPTPASKRSRTRKGVKGPILLFVGPPGTGKTSLGHSIAKALNRPFQRISLGGVRDEAEIRGHRRTYVASGPGLIVQALRKAGRRDFVLLLDEIDKIGQSNFHGDPGAALLEVLDPEQNHTFNDHYINVPIDLSQVLFICTSNTLDTISAPLLDRCEVIQLSGYTYDEKIHIARRFLLPKQLHANGLEESHLRITEPALLTMATRYTNREAGVRSLERAIGAVVRYKAVEWAEWGDAKEDKDKGKGSVVSAVKSYESVVEEHELEKILGISRWDAAEERDREERRGVVYGLVVMGQGEGGILPVETIAVPGVGRLKLTGSLGDVIKESGELALSWVKTHAYDLCITSSRAQDPLKGPDPIDIHLHLPAGAQKKDGPSAGIAMTCALVSLLTGACVPTNVAMTGEITLRGRVTPVGGVKEKILGAHRAQITKVILPWANRKDVEHDVALEIRNQMEFVFVRTVPEALEAAFGKNTLTWRRDALVLESRL